MYTSPQSEQFHQQVSSKYHLYNSVFITLPFDAIDNTGALLPLFSEACAKGLQQQMTPIAIVTSFAAKYLERSDAETVVPLLFRFIQYVERQIVLFDAIEDAAFSSINNLEGTGSLREIKERCDTAERQQHLQEFLQRFRVRTVLTAHPTQFYPGAVLGIITDLTEALRQNDLHQIEQLLAQLGKTRFIKKEKPTPYDEAVSLLWYLENVFYSTTGLILQNLYATSHETDLQCQPVIQLGFWPGGDRDGNPFVTPEITLQVAQRLRTSILKCYYTDIRKLKRKLTFTEVDVIIAKIEQQLYRSVFYSHGELYINLPELIADLQAIKSVLIEKHQALYLDEVQMLLWKVQTFGFHFASLDIRQNSAIHNQVVDAVVRHLGQNAYAEGGEKFKVAQLAAVRGKVHASDFESPIVMQTLASIEAMQTIQNQNGELGCNRYIISNNESALNVLETLAMFRWVGWENPSVDIVPLFESVDDLQQAASIMEQLYKHPEYHKHLKRRHKTQTVMLGFSDGTKDGGYLMANWSIFKAKEAITAMSRKYGIEVIFFDGRGGPPARGGGKTHKFYASLGSGIEHKEIQLTVQGQTISSNFGTLDSCRFNLENLLSAGISNGLFAQKENDLTSSDKATIDELAQLGYEKYLSFKNHPQFIPYLEQRSTLNYYAKTNIGSRPAKRKAAAQLDLSDLRAIPFVGSWSQMKQNVPGFFGVGTALHAFEKAGRWDEVQTLYKHSLFFRTLLENSMMALAKSFFPLTQYLQHDPIFGPFWELIHEEFLLTKKLLLKIAGHQELMENYPEGIASIKMREEIVLPLLVIQQYGLMQIQQIREGKGEVTWLEIYEKLVIRSLFGNTNASRNSA